MDKSYLDCGLPRRLSDSIEKMKQTWAILDANEEAPYWDCDYCELQSEINIAEVAQLISSEQAWYLRKKYLRIIREELV